jgi:glucose-6-phosphate isomerase
MIRTQGFDEPLATWEVLNKIVLRLSQKDPTLWGKDAEQEAATRLNWIDLPESSRELLPLLDALSAWSRELGHKNFILCGMGGSSLAPEVIAASFGRRLTIIDSTDPEQIRDALPSKLDHTCVIISSKSGSTIETAAAKALLFQKFLDSQLDPTKHFVVITDPASPLDLQSQREGLRIVYADPYVGGRFSALSAFGLVPCALLGVDLSLLLDDAADAVTEFMQENSSVIKVASFLAQESSRYLGLSDLHSPMPGLSFWIEQLIAESTGKEGRGVLPVVLSEDDSDLDDLANFPIIRFHDGAKLSVIAPLGAQFIFWEWVTALLSYLLQVDPFNQPNVTESKERTSEILAGKRKFVDDQPALEDEFFDIYSPLRYQSITQYFISALDSGHYLAIMAYLNRGSDIPIVQLQREFFRKSNKPITFGWGPRFLHSTGQFHKGGPRSGSFIQITAESEDRVLIPGWEITFQELISAQAAGDAEALRARGLPFLRIHLKDRQAGITALLKIAKEL